MIFFTRARTMQPHPSYPEAKMVASELIGPHPNARRTLIPWEHQTNQYWYEQMNLYKNAYEACMRENNRLQEQAQTLAELKGLIRQWNDDGMPELSQEDLYALGVIS